MVKQYHTKGREIIQSYVCAKKSTRFCASDIMEYLREHDITMNQTTVYRNLEKMTEQGTLIKTKNVSDGCCYYQYAEREHHCDEHLHLQCKKCGVVLHLNGSTMEPFYRYIREELGFTLEHKESILMGICENCSGSPA